MKNDNLYSIFLKILGFGFITIGVFLIFTSKEISLLMTSAGICFGIIFISFGEIINLLEKNIK